MSALAQTIEMLGACIRADCVRPLQNAVVNVIDIYSRIVDHFMCVKMCICLIA